MKILKFAGLFLIAGLVLSLAACPEVPGSETTVTVKFNADGGSPTPADITVNKGSSMGSKYPADPAKANASFDGWYSGTTVYASDTPINSNITLKANWLTDGSAVTTWHGLSVASGTATYHSSSNGKSDVLKVTPGTGYAILSYSLDSYANKEVTITLSMDVYLETASKVAWQVNQTGYPVVAGNTTTNLTANTWNTVSGSTKLTVDGTGKVVYLSKDQLGTAVISLANFSIKIDDGSSSPEGWVDPTTQTTPLNKELGTSYTMGGSTQGMGNLAGTPYHYEMWIEGGNSSDMELLWYGASQGGGGAFYASWKDPEDYLARIGYYWGGNNGPRYDTLGYVYMDFNYTRAATNSNPQGSSVNTAGNYSYIGTYGWAWNKNVTGAENLIEFYIVEDWFNNGWYSDGTPVGNDTIDGTQIGSFTVDGANYIIYKKTRTGPSIAGSGSTTFTQIFSVRQTTRKAGTISVTKHFDKWEEISGLKFNNLYDLKFLVEAGGGTGWFDMTWLSLSQEDTPR